MAKKNAQTVQTPYDSRTYSYYWNLFGCGLYDFEKKEACVRDYCVYMLNRTQKMFEYRGLPDTIPARMLEFYLQVNGFACFAEHNGELYAYWGGLGGEPDEYYQPTICVVSNPAQKLSKTFKIDKDCVIMRNDAFMYGLMPLFRRYATAMVENDLSFKLASINSRIQALITAPDDTTAEAGNKYLKDIEAGKLGVIASNEFLDGLKSQPVQGSMRTFTDLIEYQQYLKASWYNEIGLNANYNMKREKLSTTESQMNSDALLPLVDEMLRQRQLGVEKINEMFGTNIEVDFASSWEKLIEEFEESESTRLDSGGEMNEFGRNSEDTSQEDAGSVSNGGSIRADGAGEEVSGTSGEESVRDQTEELRESDDTGASDEGSGDNADEVNEDGSGGAGDGDAEVGEDQSTQLDSDGVEVNVEVTVNVGSEVSEDDSDRSVGEDPEPDESGDNSGDSGVSDSDESRDS